MPCRDAQCNAMPNPVVTNKIKYFRIECQLVYVWCVTRAETFFFDWTTTNFFLFVVVVERTHDVDDEYRLNANQHKRIIIIRKESREGMRNSHGFLHLGQRKPSPTLNPLNNKMSVHTCAVLTVYIHTWAPQFTNFFFFFSLPPPTFSLLEQTVCMKRNRKKTPPNWRETGQKGMEQPADAAGFVFFFYKSF